MNSTRAIKDLAEMVGAKVSVVMGMYALTDKNGERLCLEISITDMADAIEAYYGGHVNYKEARQQFEKWR